MTKSTLEEIEHTNYENLNPPTAKVSHINAFNRTKIEMEDLQISQFSG